MLHLVKSTSNTISKKYLLSKWYQYWYYDIIIITASVKLNSDYLTDKIYLMNILDTQAVNIKVRESEHIKSFILTAYCFCWFSCLRSKCFFKFDFVLNFWSQPLAVQLLWNCINQNINKLRKRNFKIFISSYFIKAIYSEI